MCHSKAHWKCIEQIDVEVVQLSSKSSKLFHVKDNMRMHELGCSWKDCKTQWTENKKEKMVTQLARHLKQALTITEERTVPTKLLPEPIAWKKMPQVW